MRMNIFIHLSCSLRMIWVVQVFVRDLQENIYQNTYSFRGVSDMTCHKLSSFRSKMTTPRHWAAFWEAYGIWPWLVNAFGSLFVNWLAMEKLCHEEASQTWEIHVRWRAEDRGCQGMVITSAIVIKWYHDFWLISWQRDRWKSLRSLKRGKHTMDRN